MGSPLLIIVGADKGGVGKTAVMRMLIDYCAARGVTPRVIDSEVPRGALKRFYPAAEMIDISGTQGQMKLFDRLADKAVTLVDMRAGILSSSLRALHDLGLLADVASGKIGLAVVHVLGPSKASLDEIEPTEIVLKEGGLHFLVRNCVGDDRFEWEPGALGDYFKGDVARAILTIPKLDGATRERVEADGMGYSAFTADESKSLILRRHAAKWLRDVYQQFDHAGIGRLVSR